MNDSTTLIFIIDASPEKGLGHLSRSLTLANAMREQGYADITIILLSSFNKIPADWTHSDFRILIPPEEFDEPHFLQWFKHAVQLIKPAWVIHDAPVPYYTLLDYLKQKACKILFVDDNGTAAPKGMDAILNTHIHANASWYTEKGYHKHQLALGPRYIMLRNSLLNQVFPKISVNRCAMEASPKNLLISMGAADPPNSAGLILQLLAQEPVPQCLNIRVLAGNGNPHYDTLIRFMDGNFPYSLTILKHTADMVKEFTWADFAITAGGTTCYELLYAGIPFMVMNIAPIQTTFVQTLTEKKLAYYLGTMGITSPTEIKARLTYFLTYPEPYYQQIERGQNIVDGKGIQRILRFIQTM